MILISYLDVTNNLAVSLGQLMHNLYEQISSTGKVIADSQGYHSLGLDIADVMFH